MIETENYLFIHLPKCGGSCISNLMEKYLNGKKVGTQHKTINAIEKKNSQKIIIGCCRNPLSWYVSLWSFGKKGAFGKDFIRKYSNKDYLYSDTTNVKYFREWLRFVLMELDTNLFHADANCMKKHNIGILTYRFFKMYNNMNFSNLKYPKKKGLVDHFILTESIESDFNKIFGTKICGTKKINKSNHLHYMKYYTPELLRLVYAKDFYIFKKFDYSFYDDYLKFCKDNV